MYQNEGEIGRAINDKIKEGIVKREDLFIVTKVGLISDSVLESLFFIPYRGLGALQERLRLRTMYVPCTFQLHPNSSRSEHVVDNFERSLALLGVDYVDLYLIHWPVPLAPGCSGKPEDIVFDDEADYVLTWKVMEQVR